jgi:methionine sulfoxide reductase catalytic subunit
MLIKRKRGWELPERLATPESVYLNRRALVAGLAAGPLLLAAGGAGRALAAGASADPSAGLYPARRNEKYTPGEGRSISKEEDATTYNNFYEFGSSKNIHRAAQRLPIRPWTVTIDGDVEKPQTIAIDDLLKMVELEERVYRHRCVEAWSMVVPWTGFPMAKLVEIAKPLSSAKYVKTQTFMNPELAPGQKQYWYPWPYIEGMTMAEATNELAFVVTGIYGQPVPAQNGAPLRIHLPWKYGFKSGKSIARFTFTAERPVSFWETLQAAEYGFWANVNPEVPHPRWSQARERVLGGGEIPTLLYNGYGEQVAGLYQGMEKEKLFM